MKTSRPVALITAVLLFVLAVPCTWAATLQLRNGQLVQGKFLGGTEASVNLLVNGKIRSYPVSDVLLIDFSSTSANATAAAATPVTPAPKAASPSPASSGKTVDVPSGTQIQVRMTSAINSSTNKAGDKFEATLDKPLVVNGVTVAPQDATVYGQVVSAQSAGTFTRAAALSLELTGIEINGAILPISTSDYVEAGKSRGKQTAERSGIGAGLGAIIGAIAGGGKGAAIGAAVGGGAGAGSQIITHGQKINIPSEAVLVFTLAQPFSVTVANP